MKRSRPLSLFLSVLILISCFTVSVSAESSSNLIDSNLENWEKTDPDYTTVKGFNHIDNRTIYRIGITPNPIGDTWVHGVRIGSIYELKNLTAGDSYSFSVDLLSYQQVIGTGLFTGFSEDFYYSPYTKYGGNLCIGLATLDKSTGYPQVVEGCSVIIDSTNYLSYFGDKLNITFEMPNIVNPCIVIGYIDVTDYGNSFMLYVENVELVNNTQDKEDGFFDKLFRFFHDLKWEIVGGSCGDVECSKTPHTSLAEKFGSKLQEGLDNLKQFFHDLKWDVTGGTCDKEDCPKKEHTSLAGRINTHIDNLKLVVNGLPDTILEGIRDFFRGFGNLILYFNWDGEYTNPFEREVSPIDKVSEWFDNLIEYVDSIGTSIENVLDSITGGLHIFDEFTSRFPWLKGIAVFCLALIVITRFIGL